MFVTFWKGYMWGDHRAVVGVKVILLWLPFSDKERVGHWYNLMAATTQKLGQRVMSLRTTLTGKGSACLPSASRGYISLAENLSCLPESTRQVVGKICIPAF